MPSKYFKTLVLQLGYLIRNQLDPLFTEVKKEHEKYTNSSVKSVSFDSSSNSKGCGDSLSIHRLPLYVLYIYLLFDLFNL